VLSSSLSSTTTGFTWEMAVEIMMVMVVVVVVLYACWVVRMLELNGSRSVESRLVDRTLDNVSQTLPEVVDDAAIKYKQINEELARLQQQLHDSQVVCMYF